MCFFYSYAFCEKMENDTYKRLISAEKQFRDAEIYFEAIELKFCNYEPDSELDMTELYEAENYYLLSKGVYEARQVEYLMEYVDSPDFSADTESFSPPHMPSTSTGNPTPSCSKDFLNGMSGFGLNKNEIEEIEKYALSSQCSRDTDEMVNPKKRKAPQGETSGEELCFQVKKKSSTESKKFKSLKNVYQCGLDMKKFKNSNKSHPCTLASMSHSLNTLFGKLLDETCDKYSNTSTVQVVINADGLNHPVSTKCLPKNSMSPSVISATIEQVVQSGEDIQVDNSFEISVIVVEDQMGRGRPLSKEELYKKRSVIQIRNDDSLCFPR